MMRAQIPSDLIVEVLARLPVKDLIRLRCVCKRWKALVADNTFIKKHLRYAPKKFMSLTDMGLYSLGICQKKLDLPLDIRQYDSGCILHCQGMLCLAFNDDSLVVWNPFTKDFKIIPTPKLYLNSNILGFGYDRSRDEYKIVTFIDRLDSSIAQIFAFKSNSWRESVLIPFPNWYYTDRKGTALNNNLLWIARRSVHNQFILCFDLVTEKYKEMPCPPSINNNSRCSCLGVMRGNLSVIDHYAASHMIVISVTKEISMNITSWDKFMTISTLHFPGIRYPPDHIDFMCFTKDNELLATLKGFTENREFHVRLLGGEERAFVYRSKEKRFEECKFSASLSEFYCLVECIESLVSVNCLFS